MSKLHHLNDTTVASGRDWLRAVQCLWPVPKAPRHSSSHQPEDGCDQESQPGQDGEPGAKEKSKHLVMVRCGRSDMFQSLFEGNGIAAPRSEAGTPPPSLLNNQRASRKTSSGGSERSFSPVSRTDTPTTHHPSNIAPQHLFDGVSLSEHAFQPSPSMPSLNLRAPSPGSTSSANDRHLEPPQTYDGLLQFNTTLKTRVSELEVINDLFRGRVNELEQSDANARRAETMQQESETQLRQLLEQTQARENELKRQVEELEREVADLRGPEPRAKRQRVSNDSEYPDPPLPFTA